MNLVEIKRLAEETKDENHSYDYFLQKLVSFYDIRTVLECGTGGGGSSMRMVENNNHVSIITIDKDLPPATRSHLSKYYSNITVVEGDTREVQEEIEKILDGRTIGLLFLDSAHDGNTAKSEFGIYSKYLSEVALVVADDISLTEAMKKFWVEMPGEKADFLYLHPQHNAGFGVSIIKDKKV